VLLPPDPDVLLPVGAHAVSRHAVSSRGLRTTPKRRAENIDKFDMAVFYILVHAKVPEVW
jgi:hypothetical protein